MSLSDMINTPVPPYGYRLVDKVKDAPKRNGDLFWNEGDGWSDVGLLTSLFDRDFVYARKIKIPEGWELIPKGEPVGPGDSGYGNGDFRGVTANGKVGAEGFRAQAYIRRVKQRASESCCCKKRSDHAPEFAAKSDYAATETTLPNGTEFWLYTEDPANLLERIDKLEAENADLRSKLSGIPHVIGKNVEASFRDMLNKEGVIG